MRMTATKAHVGAAITFLVAWLAQLTGLVDAPAVEELRAAGETLTAAAIEVAASAIAAGINWVVVYLTTNRPKGDAGGGTTLRCASGLIVLGGMMLLGCTAGQPAPGAAPPSVEAQIRIACETYADLLDTLAVAAVEGRLDDEAIAVVDQSIAVAQPICLGLRPPGGYDGRALLDEVRSIVLRLYVLTGDPA